tara:strand:+ start:25 stop:1494 length:1470 start_codon:yes stop_codon:yes gene_type:complete
MVEISPIFGRGPRMSAATYTGRAVAPAAVENAAESKALITKNSLQLGVVSAQLQGMTAQMQALTGSLQVIATNLATSQELQQKQDNQAAELENKLAQQKLREGKESLIEKKIQAAALAPAQKIASKAQFTLGRLGDFFTAILGGWLLNQGIQTLKALSEGNSDKLKEIRNNVLKNLAIIAGIFVGVKLAIGAILGTFSLLGVKLLAVAAVGLFTKPGRQLLEFIKDVGKNIVNAAAESFNFPSPFKPEPVDNGEGEGEDPIGRVEGDDPPDPIDDSNKSADDNNIEQPPTKNQWWDPADIFPNPGEIIGDEEDNVGGDSLKSIESIKGSLNSAESIIKAMGGSERNEGTPEPKPVMKSETKTTFDMGFGEIDLSKPIGYEANTAGQKVTDPETLEYIRQEQYIGKYGTLPPSMLQSLSKSKDVAKRVSQAPEEPGVTVVPMPVSAGGGAPSQPVPVSGGPIGGVEMYATSNDDNMYTFGAMSNFNVVGV